MTQASRPRRAAPGSRVPTLREERRLLREGHRLVAGMDEVGRGALAGPVTVGVVVVDLGTRTAPSGVRDSKLLTPAAREAMAPRVRRWALASAVGHAEPEEVDRYGIIAALRLAGRRALAALPEVPTCVLLDGSHDWLSPPRRRAGPVPQEEALFDLPEPVPAPAVPRIVPATDLIVPDPALTGPDPAVAFPLREPAPVVELSCEPQVRTMVKADLRCAAVAAASVLAKVARDAIMVERAACHPEYGWHENKGYSAPEHGLALRRLGPCPQHRRTWSLPLSRAAGGPGEDGLPDGAADPLEADYLGADLLEADLIEASMLHEDGPGDGLDDGLEDALEDVDDRPGDGEPDGWGPAADARRVADLRDGMRDGLEAAQGARR